MRQQKSSSHIPLSEAIDQVCDREAQLKQITKRNIEVKRRFALSKQGRLLDVQALEPEATWVKRMRLSQSEQLRALHGELMRHARSLAKSTDPAALLTELTKFWSGMREAEQTLRLD